MGGFWLLVPPLCWRAAPAPRSRGSAAVQNFPDARKQLLGCVGLVQDGIPAARRPVLGLELVADRESRTPFPRAERVTERVVRTARESGLLLYWVTGLDDGTNGDAILLGPPFVITEPELERLVDVLASAIRSVMPAPVG